MVSHLKGYLGEQIPVIKSGFDVLFRVAAAVPDGVCNGFLQ
jgi:hypothetical protein